MPESRLPAARKYEYEREAPGWAISPPAANEVSGGG